MKYLLLILLTITAISVILAQDGLDLTRGQTSYALDGSINNGTDIMVARWVSTQSNGFGPLGSSRYKGEVQVVHRLFGQCPETFRCDFKIWTVPKPGVKWKVPESGEICLMMGSYAPDQQQFHVTRFIEPTEANLELIGTLIRQYKAKELAADPKAAAMLENNLATALKSAAAQVKVPSTVVAPASETADDSWLWIAAATLVLLALLLWQRKRR